MTRQDAMIILQSLTQGESLLRHARSVELVMEGYALKLGQDQEEWAITGLLHDADYEKYPEEHPQVIVEKLRELGEENAAYAISAHYTKWGVPQLSLLDKALLACDELTGFIIACCQVRPGKITGLKAKSVIKKLKQKSFAAKVDRNEVYQGAQMLGVNLSVHIDFIISVLERNKQELDIIGQ